MDPLQRRRCLEHRAENGRRAPYLTLATGILVADPRRCASGPLLDLDFTASFGRNAILPLIEPKMAASTAPRSNASCR